mmetsp:Transcript_47556/g.136735  ORF Transcript_47556/g.136735 Transcript_47556/m.136735 type:complete len:546 (+) Transcript_47556:101-1738(+)
MVDASWRSGACGSRKIGMFTDHVEDPCTIAPQMRDQEYLAAFHAFDTDGAGQIDLPHLSGALQAVQSATEQGGGCQNVSMRPFHSTTCCFLCSRFGDGSRLFAPQFCALLGHLHTLRLIFMQADLDRSGGIELGELQRALQMSGANMDASVVAQILSSYDADGSGALEFDEFVQLRLEWDHYISAWDACTCGSSAIQPGQLLSILEEVKRATEPITMALERLGLSLRYLFYAHTPFRAQTCEQLIIRFGGGNHMLSFEQFCCVMVSLRDMKVAFCRADAEGDGSLNLEELATAMAHLGMHIPLHLLVDIGRKYAATRPGELEFDEFVQMIVEWSEVWQERWRFGPDLNGRIGPAQLRDVLGTLRAVYRMVTGAQQVFRPFNFHTCRWLVAKFGTVVGSEAFAQGLTLTEFVNLVWYLKDAHAKFLRYSQTHSGALSVEELGAAMDACGIHLSGEAIANICRSYDVDGSGTFEFDEFLQLALECQLYDQCFDVCAMQPALLTATETGRPCPAPVSGCGLVTLDKSAFLSLVFAVPRHVGRDRAASG